MQENPPPPDTRPRVLVVEDEPDLALTVSFNLEQAGFAVTSTPSGREALERCLREPPDAVLLDVMLPDLSGLEVLRAVRADPRCLGLPILLVTARGEESERVEGFSLGADDYVVKPFSVQELVLRVRAILRRSASDRGRVAEQLFGPLRVDRGSHRAWVHGDELVLTALEFRLLTRLMDGGDKVQSRADILSGVWGDGVHVEARTVDQHIKRLRDKLGDAGVFVHTVRGVGYRFAATPEDHE